MLRLKGFKIIKSAAMSFLILCMMLMSSCTFLGTVTRLESINFNDDTLTIAVGESVVINLSRVTITPKITTNKRFSIEVGDSEVAEVFESTVTGIKVGETTITVVSEDGGKTDSCKLIVLEEEPQQLKISWSGSLFQTTTNLSAVTFYPDFGRISSPGKEIEWQVNSNGSVIAGVVKQTASKPYSFLPTESGMYEIRAKMQSGANTFEDSVILRVYSPYLVEPEIVFVEGELVQEKDSYSLVKYSVTYQDDALNPARVIRWFLNDGFFSQGKDFAFTPSRAGSFKISVEIDGVMHFVANLTAKGSLVPQNLRLNYDNCYPNVYLSWDDTGFDNMGFEVQVRDSSGKLVYAKGDEGDISTARDNTKAMFLKNSVNLSEVIGANCVKNMFNNKFSISVRTLGNGSGFEASDFSSPLVTRQLEVEAREFLSDKILGDTKNLYAYDFEEFVEIMEHAFFWRNNPRIPSDKKTDSMSVKTYLEFSVLDEVDLISRAYKSLHITGDVEFSIGFNDKVIEYTVTFKTDSLPSKVSSGKLGDYSGGLGAVRPHINYDASKYRTVLPIDSLPNTISVTDSEQLYFAAQKGLRPVPVKGSEADKIYSYARDILLKIVTLDMTEVEKAHAIYDWIMWQVDYDHAVLNVSTLKESVKYESYYLESVFNNEFNYAVCDGIAKAYSLLCNMEGLECVRVTGYAGVYAKGGHAWNKVKVNGAWYVVDATWGDEIKSFKGQMINESKWEMASHRYFLVTDSQIAATHEEDEFNNFPKTTLVPYNYYDDDFAFGDLSLDYYINCAADEAYSETLMLAKYMISMREAALDVENPNPMYAANAIVPGTNRMFSNYIGFDIKINSSLASRYGGAGCVLVEAFKQADPLNPFVLNTNYFLLYSEQDDALYITVIIPLNLV